MNPLLTYIQLQEVERFRQGLPKATHMTISPGDYQWLCGWCETLQAYQELHHEPVAITEYRGMAVLVGVEGCGVLLGGPAS